MLGLHWKEFDRVSDRFYAEGNGYIFRGFREESSLVFAFEDIGLNTDSSPYLIRRPEVREMCFGIVPTILDNDASQNNWDSEEGDRSKEMSMFRRPPAYQHKPWPTMLLGSTEEIQKPLTLLGCDSYTIHCTCSLKSGTHIFPVLFEVIGMLARIMHMKERRSTRLPNPNIFPFVKHQVYLPRLIDAFLSVAAEELPDGLSGKTDSEDVRYFFELQRVLSNSQDIVVQLGQMDPDAWSAGSHPDLMTQLHNAILSADSIVHQVQPSLVYEVVREHLRQVCRATSTSSGDAKYKEQRNHLPSSSFPHHAGVDTDTGIIVSRRIVETKVFPDGRRVHTEELHNGRKVEASDNHEPGRLPRQASFEALRHVPAEQREHLLMKFYFEDIRSMVVCAIKSKCSEWDKSRGETPARY